MREADGFADRRAAAALVELLGRAGAQRAADLLLEIEGPVGSETRTVLLVAKLRGAGFTRHDSRRVVAILIACGILVRGKRRT